MLVLGISRGHDAGVCLFENERVLCVVEAERVHKIKHADGPGTIAECARVAFLETGAKASQVGRVVIADSYRDDIEVRKPDLRSQLHDPKLLGRLGTVGLLPAIGGGDIGIDGLKADAPVYAACHHACHAAAALYMSGYEEALVYVYDGYGTCCGTICYKYADNKLIRLDHTVDRLLVGWRYQLLANFVREIDKDTTKVYDFAGKLMGLSAFGTPQSSVVAELKTWLHQSFEDYKKSWDATSNSWFPGLVNSGGFLLNSASVDDPEFRCLLASLQLAMNEAVTDEISSLVERYQIRKIVLSGGCALNILANDAIEGHSDVESLFVPPNAGDSGLPMGAAIIGGVHEGTALHFPSVPLMEKRSPYKGPHILIDVALKRAHGTQTRSTKARVLNRLVASLREGGIIGFVKGPMEIGPRALGHRSLLADATHPNMRELLNTKIKRREWWRPFGPVARSVDAREYFEFNAECPYMLRSANVRAEWRDRLGAVTHVDGSARLQVLRDESDHPELWYVLSQLKKLTGVGVCLNTSLNLGGMPMMNSAGELASFLHSTGVDMMYVDGVIVERDA